MNAQTAVVSRPAQGQQVATKADIFHEVREELEQRSADLKMALPSHITPEKFQRTVITAIQQNPDLLNATRRSLILACMKAAQDGLLPDGREAALVIFKKRYKDPADGQWKERKEVAYIPMVYGVRKKILQSRDATGKPVVSALEVGVVYRREYEEKRFYFDVGLTPPLGHRPSMDLSAEDTTDDKIIGAYSIATMADGTKSYEFMRRFEIDKIRESSQTGATKDRWGKPRDPSGPWVDWFPAQCKKTVLKQHAKSLPQSGDLLLDAYDQDFDAGRSSVLALGSGSEDAPKLIDYGDDDHDPETGEVIDQTTDQGNASEEGTATAEQSGDERQPEQAESTTEAAEPSTDEQQAGDQRHAQQQMADRLITEIKATRTQRAARDAFLDCELDRASLPDDLAAEVQEQYERHYDSVPAEPAKQTAGAK